MKMYNGRSAIEKRSILNETMSVNYEIVYLAWNISVFRSYENDLFPCNNKSILMSILLLFGIMSVWNLIRYILSY